ncbi:MAG: carboxyltransferase domain-containing protein [Deltaproteobacteria bacterium]|nr:carboxyltransferase domain-containing protein [Deltaproteobacteria bacterium]
MELPDGAQWMGDRALRLPRPEGSARALVSRLRGLAGVEDLVLGDHAVAVTFTETPPQTLVASLLAALRETPREAPAPPALHVIKVRYDGPDLRAVALHAGLGPEEAAALHASVTYTVELLGFAPGFAYLGPVPEALRLPRRSTPRARVPAGSVAVALDRTGVYPFDSPGGWNLLGTAVGFAPFEPTLGARLGLGDRVRFERVL